MLNRGSTFSYAKQHITAYKIHVCILTVTVFILILEKNLIAPKKSQNSQSKKISITVNSSKIQAGDAIRNNVD